MRMGTKEKKVISRGKRILRVVLVILGILILIVGGYFTYLMVDYHRLEPDIVLTTDNQQESEVPVGVPLKAVSYNIGFGAYIPDFTFFMDGGVESWARSEELCRETVQGAADYVKDLSADIILFQEIDVDSTRSYHIDQYRQLQDVFFDYASTFAVNYDSSFLFYPFTEPHGESYSGIGTFSRFGIRSAVRRKLEIDQSIPNKFFDLDRCYSVNRIPAENGNYLCVFNVHLTAYGGDESIRTGQFIMLCEEMEREYKAGNYVICGGDFNQDVTGDSVTYFNGADAYSSWAQPLQQKYLPDGFMVCEETTAERSPSVRDNDIPYTPGTSFVATVDGFIVSDNVEVIALDNADLEFLYSDHNPVVLEFVLK